MRTEKNSFAVFGLIAMLALASFAAPISGVATELESAADAVVVESSQESTQNDGEPTGEELVETSDETTSGATVEDVQTVEEQQPAGPTPAEAVVDEPADEVVDESFEAPVVTDTIDTEAEEPLVQYPTGGYIMEGETAPSVQETNRPMRLFAQRTAQQSAYSSVDKGFVTPVRNQGAFQTCWSFATIAAIESSLLAHGSVSDAQSLDLSERHLAYFNYHIPADPFGNTKGDAAAPYPMSGEFGSDNYLGNGGNSSLAANILVSGIGAVPETAAPYSKLISDYTGASTNWDSFYKNTNLSPSQAFTQRAYYVVGTRYIPLSDRSAVKAAIKEYGAVSIAYQHMNSSEFYTSQTGAYYSYKQLSGYGHGVVVVGWDDNYSTDNFKGAVKPNSPGAWLVKNSWGLDFGNDGYMWLSYEDYSLNTNDAAAIAFEAVPASTYDNIYQYDGSPALYYNHIESGGSIANIYEAKGATKTEELKAVQFNMESPNVNYSIQVYLNVEGNDPESGTAALSEPISGSTKNKGIYTVDFDKPISLKAGMRYSVVLTLSQSGSNDVKYSVDASNTSVASRWVTLVSSVQAGQSFERDRAGAAWDDLSSTSCDSLDEPASVARIKVLTTNANKVDITKASVSDIANQSYTGKALKPSVNITYGDTKLSAGVDYQLNYKNNVTVGTAKLEIVGMGEYAGTKEVTFTISPASIAKANVAISGGQSYNGKALTPKPTVTLGATTLKEGSDYTLSYKNNVNAGSASIVITGKGNYGGTKSASFKIAPKSIADTTIASIADQLYTGKALTPKPSIKNGGVFLKEGTDYTLSYKDNTSAGKATLTITGKGNFTGTKSVNFKIVGKNLSDATISSIGVQPYTGKAITPQPSVKLAGTTLKLNRDYTLSYKNNVKTGTATVVVTGKGNYRGSKSVSFQIKKDSSGWRKSSGKWWYETSKIKGTYYKSCWATIKGKRYYFDKSGWMKTGWIKLGNTWYFCDNSGAMKTGWVKTGGVWYFLDKSTGAMKTGWITDAGKRYYLTSSGAMKTGWLKLSGKWYYFDGSGAMKKGWVKTGGKWYYLDKSTGVMLANQRTPDGYWVGSSGAWNGR